MIMPHIAIDNERAILRLEAQHWFLDAKMDYFVSEIPMLLNMDDETEITQSLTNAMEACRSVKLPINRNFKRIFRYNGNDIIADWKISSLAFYLMVINCNPSNELVAQAQIHFALKNSVRS